MERHDKPPPILKFEAVIRVDSEDSASRFCASNMDILVLVQAYLDE